MPELSSGVSFGFASAASDVLAGAGIRIAETTPLANLLKRPELTLELLVRLLPASLVADVSCEELGVVLSDVKYSGYVESQRAAADSPAGE